MKLLEESQELIEKERLQEGFFRTVAMAVLGTKLAKWVYKSFKNRRALKLLGGEAKAKKILDQSSKDLQKVIEKELGETKPRKLEVSKYEHGKGWRSGPSIMWDFNGVLVEMELQINLQEVIDKMIGVLAQYSQAEKAKLDSPEVRSALKQSLINLFNDKKASIENSIIRQHEKDIMRKINNLLEKHGKVTGRDVTGFEGQGTTTAKISGRDVEVNVKKLFKID